MNLIYSERVFPRNMKEFIYGIKEDEEEGKMRKGRGKAGREEGRRDRGREKGTGRQQRSGDKHLVVLSTNKLPLEQG